MKTTVSGHVEQQNFALRFSDDPQVSLLRHAGAVSRLETVLIQRHAPAGDLDPAVPARGQGMGDLFAPGEETREHSDVLMDPDGLVESVSRGDETEPSTPRFLREGLLLIPRRDPALVELSGDPVEVVADFLFGREDLIPDMVARLLKLWEGAGSPVPTFQYYLERHIALDGDEHGPAARRMLQAMAGHDAMNWEKAATAALEAIYSRINLWDGVLQKIHHLDLPRSNPIRSTFTLQAA